MEDERRAKREEREERAESKAAEKERDEERKRIVRIRVITNKRIEEDKQLRREDKITRKQNQKNTTRKKRRKRTERGDNNNNNEDNDEVNDEENENDGENARDDNHDKNDVKEDNENGEDEMRDDKREVNTEASEIQERKKSDARKEGGAAAWAADAAAAAAAAHTTTQTIQEKPRVQGSFVDQRRTIASPERLHFHDPYKPPAHGDGSTFEVESILEEKECPKSGQTVYRVRWKGYDKDADTWEPMSNLANAADALLDFHNTQAHTGMAAASPAWRNSGVDCSRCGAKVSSRRSLMAHECQGTNTKGEVTEIGSDEGGSDVERRRVSSEEDLSAREKEEKAEEREEKEKEKSKRGADGRATRKKREEKDASEGRGETDEKREEHERKAGWEEGEGKHTPQQTTAGESAHPASLAAKLRLRLDTPFTILPVAIEPRWNHREAQPAYAPHAQSFERAWRAGTKQAMVQPTEGRLEGSGEPARRRTRPSLGQA
jgi:hypothetical protein